MESVHAAIQLFGTLPMVIQAGAAVIVALGALFGAIATTRAQWAKLTRHRTPAPSRASSKKNQRTTAKSEQPKTTPAGLSARTKASASRSDRSANAQNSAINPIINPTISPTISPQVYIQIPVPMSPVIAQSGDSQPQAAQPPAEIPTESSPAMPIDALTSNSETSGSESTSEDTAIDAALTAPVAELSIAPAIKQDAVHVAPSSGASSAPIANATQAQVQPLPIEPSVDVAAVLSPSTEANAMPGEDASDIDVSTPNRAETTLDQEPASAELPGVLPGTPSGRLLLDSQIRQQRELRSNMRRALRNASIIVQEARLSLQKYARTSSSERPFQNEVRVLGVLHDYLNSVEGTFSNLNSAMIKLEVDWIGGDPRRVLLSYPDPFSPAFQTEDSHRSAPELRRTLLSILEDMVATARSINMQVERRTYSNPNFPNASWVYVIPKKYDESLDDAATDDLGGEITESNEVVGDEDLGEAVDVDQETPTEED